jgi:ribosome-binding factor A
LSGSKRSRRSAPSDRGGSVAHTYPRSARVNEILREVLAEELERLDELDQGFGLITITAVQCDPDLRRARVLFASLEEGQEEALAASRVRLQAAIAKQVRLKRTPQLSFAADPAVLAGRRVEDILRELPEPGPEIDGEPESDQSGETTIGCDPG